MVLLLIIFTPIFFLNKLPATVYMNMVKTVFAVIIRTVFIIFNGFSCEIEN